MLEVGSVSQHSVLIKVAYLKAGSVSLLLMSDYEGVPLVVAFPSVAPWWGEADCDAADFLWAWSVDPRLLFETKAYQRKCNFCKEMYN